MKICVMHYTSALLGVLIRTRCSFVTCWKCSCWYLIATSLSPNCPLSKGHLIIQGYSHCPRADYTKCLANAKYYLKKKKKFPLHQCVITLKICLSFSDSCKITWNFCYSFITVECLPLSSSASCTSLKVFFPEGTPHTNLHILDTFPGNSA